MLNYYMRAQRTRKPQKRMSLTSNVVAIIPVQGCVIVCANTSANTATRISVHASSA